MVDSLRVTVARARPAGFEVAGEQLDVGASGGEQAQLPLAAPGGELAQVQRVGLAGQAGVPGQEPANASFSASENAGSITARAAGDGVVVADMGYLPRADRDRNRSRQRMTTST